MRTRPAFPAITFLVAVSCSILAAGALSAPSFAGPAGASRTPVAADPAPADSLPWHDLAGLLVERMALLSGERVLLLGSHGRFDAIVDPLRRAVAEAGGVVAGAYTVRPPEAGGAGAGPWDGVLDGEMVELQRQLADVEVGVMLPGPSAGDAAYAALQRNLEELGGSRRTVHFHWQGAYGLDNLLREPDAIIDAAYVDALMNTDYAALAAAQAKWIDRARRGEIRVTTPEGTDIAFRIGDRPVTRQDGDASAARALRARSLIDREIELPAGAVRVAPIEESVSGVIAFPPMVWRGSRCVGCGCGSSGGVSPAGRLTPATRPSRPISTRAARPRDRSGSWRWDSIRSSAYAGTHRSRGAGSRTTGTATVSSGFRWATTPSWAEG